MTTASNVLEILSRESHRPESDVLARAVETGLRQLWMERTLGLYLRGQASRQEAIEAAGLDRVELAERQKTAALEDVAWALAVGN